MPESSSDKAAWAPPTVADPPGYASPAPSPSHPYAHYEVPRQVGSLPSPAPAAPKRKRTGLIVAIVVGAVVLSIAGVSGAVVVFQTWNSQSTDHPSLAAANDCLAGTTTQVESLRIVNCDDFDATLQVVERLENQTFTPLVADTNCSDPDVTSTMFYSYPFDDTRGLLLCLKPYFGPPQ